MPSRRYHKTSGIIAELTSTPHGLAWAITSPDNGFECFAREAETGLWETFYDIDALGRDAPFFHRFPLLETVMESIALNNRATKENRAAWSARKEQGSVVSFQQEKMMQDNSAQQTAKKLLNESGNRLDILISKLPRQQADILAEARSILEDQANPECAIRDDVVLVAA